MSDELKEKELYQLAEKRAEENLDAWDGYSGIDLYQHAFVQGYKSASQWIPVGEKLPEDGDEVICCYVGVYGPRIVNFWRDAGLNPHFGGPRNQYGSQPATHWMPISLPTPPKDKAK